MTMVAHFSLRGCPPGILPYSFDYKQIGLGFCFVFDLVYFGGWGRHKGSGESDLGGLGSRGERGTLGQISKS